MKINLFLSLFIVLFLSCNQPQRLFNENSKDWITKGNANWTFSNNELIGIVDDGAGFVITNQSYKDFSLELEFQPDSTINSGVFIRCKNQDINPTDCYELNIWDLHPDQTNRTGAIVTRKEPLAIVSTIDKWNTYRIKVEKNEIKVWINDTLTVNTKDEKLSDGYIGLQAKGTGKVRFRNVKLKNLTID
ncbi:DUF1080 domain-containing protein [Winogradskyella sp. R77965]|uniref:DUF1080 domain-containing protein n=1 Tax=Winogradskyella sp. R77965 TaxID=3093872 RepID=UPI0037DDDF54